jgi:hypothetical protein
VARRFLTARNLRLSLIENISRGDINRFSVIQKLQLQDISPFSLSGCISRGVQVNGSNNLESTHLAKFWLGSCQCSTLFKSAYSNVHNEPGLMGLCIQGILVIKFLLKLLNFKN